LVDVLFQKTSIPLPLKGGRVVWFDLPSKNFSFGSYFPLNFGFWTASPLGISNNPLEVGLETFWKQMYRNMTKDITQILVLTKDVNIMDLLMRLY